MRKYFLILLLLILPLKVNAANTITDNLVLPTRDRATFLNFNQDFSNLGSVSIWNYTNLNAGYETISMALDNVAENLYFAMATYPHELGLSYGSGLTICGLDTLKDSYYSMTYFFLTPGNSYIYPGYSVFSKKISQSSGLGFINFNQNYTTINSSANIAQNNMYAMPLVGQNPYLQSFSFIIQAGSTTSCLSVAYKSNSYLDTYQTLFLGYQFKYIGNSTLTQSDITNALNSQTTTINNAINSQTTTIANYLNNQTTYLENKINSKINEQIAEEKKTQQAVNDQTSTITNSDSSGATGDASNFFSGFTTNTFGLTSIITSPLQLIGSITSSTCSPLSLTIPFLENQTLDLPCLSTIYQSYFGSFFQVYQTITFGVISYWVCVRIFALVKDFKNPEHDEIEVLEL